MTSEHGKQTTETHILLNISRRMNKTEHMRKQTMNIIEYMRNIFLENSYTKCVGETILRPFSKASKLSKSLDLSLKFSVCSYCMSS